MKSEVFVNHSKFISIPFNFHQLIAYSASQLCWLFRVLAFEKVELQYFQLQHGPFQSYILSPHIDIYLVALESMKAACQPSVTGILLYPPGSIPWLLECHNIKIPSCNTPINPMMVIGNKLVAVHKPLSSDDIQYSEKCCLIP